MISYFENVNRQFKRLPNIEKWNYISCSVIMKGFLTRKTLFN